MPGDPQLLAFAVKILLTAAIVVTAATATERAGPLLGALIVTLPIGAGPSYVFLAFRRAGAVDPLQHGLEPLPVGAVAAPDSAARARPQGA